MKKQIFSKKGILALLFFYSFKIHAGEILPNRTPVAEIYNPGPHFSLINSIEYHPKEPLFCITYTHNNKVVLYKIDAKGSPEIFQSIGNPTALLSEPQHAAFSPDGEKIAVANWYNQTLSVYLRKSEGEFQEKPATIIPPPSALINHKPHGIAFSPCGQYLAIAYGAAPYNGKALALYSVKDADLELIHFLKGPEQIPGIPKGITFSPDGTCLLVTFSDINAIVIFNLSESRTQILEAPRQIIQGKETGLFRPEDIKISADRSYCAVSNSEKNNLAFFAFDQTTNLITSPIPCDILENPEGCLQFPHGIAFSPDGSFMIVTQFGPVWVTKEGDVLWDLTLTKEHSKFNVYDLRNDQGVSSNSE